MTLGPLSAGSWAEEMWRGGGGTGVLRVGDMGVGMKFAPFIVAAMEIVIAAIGL